MMKRSLAIVTFVIFALAVPVSMLAQQNSKAEKEIGAATEELRQAYLKGGAEAAAVLDKYYADDYTGVRGDGKVLTKAQELEAYKSGVIKYQANETRGCPGFS
jgi:hypothetical protein